MGKIIVCGSIPTLGGSGGMKLILQPLRWLLVASEIIHKQKDWFLNTITMTVGNFSWGGGGGGSQLEGISLISPSE